MADTLTPPGQTPKSAERAVTTPQSAPRPIDRASQRDLCLQALTDPRTTTDQLAQTVNRLARLTTRGDPEGRNRSLRIDASAVTGIIPDQIPPYMRFMLSASGSDPKADIGNLDRVEESNGRVIFTFSSGASLSLSTETALVEGRVVQINATTAGGVVRSPRFTEQIDTRGNTQNVPSVLRDTARFLNVLHAEAVDSLPDDDSHKIAYMETMGIINNNLPKITENLPNDPHKALNVLAGNEGVKGETLKPEQKPVTERYEELLRQIKVEDPRTQSVVIAILENRAQFGLGDITDDQITTALKNFDFSGTITRFNRFGPDMFQDSHQNTIFAKQQLDADLNNIPDLKIRALVKIMIGQKYMTDQYFQLAKTLHTYIPSRHERYGRVENVALGLIKAGSERLGLDIWTGVNICRDAVSDTFKKTYEVKLTEKHQQDVQTLRNY